jgi:hypothetical protein
MVSTRAFSKADNWILEKVGFSRVRYIPNRSDTTSQRKTTTINGGDQEIEVDAVTLWAKSGLIKMRACMLPNQTTFMQQTSNNNWTTSCILR